ncbi:SCO7613 C-terminal domain-containing membrane protein, partial [Nonomuraea rosea]|uniref:SCO7613 C-terminal domain-containing membrane protein n=1 Tax=Nonomuraea rosea TaxID=638574 RepID=UPI003CD077C7
AAGALAAGLPVEQAAFAVLVVVATAFLVAAAPDTLRPAGGAVSLGVEVPGWCLAWAAIVMTVRDAGLLCLALACSGVLALAVALRRDRRWAAWLGLGLLQVALWIRLAVWDVTAPEAYTVPLSVAGLVVAWLARRRDPGVSSWLGYGTALALTFLPSAYAAWNDPGLVRPLLLGVAAFAATLAGARARLQAPLLLGGAVLVVTAAHEFAPALAELVGEGPRWLPIALAGAFLLFTGATYEHRLRDLRKIRRLIVRMR